MTQDSASQALPASGQPEPAPRPARHIGPETAKSREAIALRSAEFRKGREQGWKQLDDMVGRVEKKGIGALSSREVEQLPLLYRSMMSSLSVARNIALDRNMLLYLENLSLRAYLVVYGPRSGMMENLRDFLLYGFPMAVRSIRKHLAIVSLVMLVGVIAGYALVSADLGYFHVIVPEDLAGGRGPGSTAEDLIETELFAPWPGFVDTFIVFANSLFRHNAVVGILCFGLGFALGIPTILLLIYNGLVIGAFIALHAEHGLTVDFIGWLSIHGVTEILAILLCAASGLAVAEKILFPGDLPRLDSLAKHGRTAASVAAGAVLLFFIAGFIEGGFRQLINNTAGRYTFALITAVLWFLYFTSGRRKPDGKGQGGSKHGHTD